MHESDDCKRLTIVLEIRDIMEYLAQNAPVVSALAAIVLGAERPQRQPYWLCLVHVPFQCGNNTIRFLEDV